MCLSDGTIVVYSWQQIAGPTVTLTGADTATPSFTAPSVNTQTKLTFQLTVTDSDNATAADTIDVTVFDLDADTDGDGLPDGWEMQYFGQVRGSRPLGTMSTMSECRKLFWKCVR